MDEAALETELDELYVMRRKLLTGSKMESGGNADRRFQYKMPTLPEVEARIRSIEHQLGINTDQARGPIGVDLS
ncbi:MAG: hypothetical protein ACOC8P_00580 [Dichotomicrobium sp.]